MRNEYAFATQFLAAKKNIEIRIGDKRILEWDGYPNYECGIPDTKITIGNRSEYTEITGETRKVESYPALQEMGFKIVSIPVSEAEARFFPRMKTKYAIVRTTHSLPDYGRFPTARGHHHVDHNVKHGYIRLVGINAGPFGFSEWIQIIKKRAPRTTNYSIYQYSKPENVEALQMRMARSMSPVQEEIRYKEIKEVPVLFTDAGHILCIKRENDMPKIGIVGKTGTGKTTLFNSIWSHWWWKFRDNMISINDHLGQQITWAKPNEDKNMITYLNKINETPNPLPIVFLNPQIAGLEETPYEDTNISFKISISFEDFVNSYEYFKEGMKKWDLGNSHKYFLQMKDEIRNCKTVDEIKEKLENRYKDNKNLRPSVEKIVSVFDSIYKTDFLDTSSGVPAKWKFKTKGIEKEMSPVIGLMECDLIPTINTATIENRPFFPQWERRIIDSVFDWQNARRKYCDKRTMIGVDEIGAIYKKRKRRTCAAESLIKCAAEGRPIGLGMMWDTQSYMYVDEEIGSNTSYLFSFNLSSSAEANAIIKDLELDPSVKKQMANLKKFECVAVTKDKKFVVYTADGQRYESSGCYKGRAIPPLNANFRPGMTSNRTQQNDEESEEGDE